MIAGADRSTVKGTPGADRGNSFRAVWFRIKRNTESDIKREQCSSLALAAPAQR